MLALVRQFDFWSCMQRLAPYFDTVKNTVVEFLFDTNEIAEQVGFATAWRTVDHHTKSVLRQHFRNFLVRLIAFHFKLFHNDIVRHTFFFNMDTLSGSVTGHDVYQDLRLERSRVLKQVVETLVSLQEECDLPKIFTESIEDPDMLEACIRHWFDDLQSSWAMNQEKRRGLLCTMQTLMRRLKLRSLQQLYHPYTFLSESDERT
jgi:hypothetical protein